MKELTFVVGYLLLLYGVNDLVMHFQSYHELY